MANLYVRSGGNAGAWTGTSASVATAAASDSAGDRIYVASDHAESNATPQTWAFAGTVASPVHVLGSTTAAAPPTALATSATCTTTGSNAFTISGSAYLYGLTISCGSGTGSPTLQVCSTDLNIQTFESCNLRVAATGASCRIDIGSSTSGHETTCRLKNSNLQLNATGQMVRLSSGLFEWEGGALEAGSTPTNLFQANAGYGASVLRISGVDFSAVGTGLGLVTVNTGRVNAIIRNCKLPASWAGTLASGLTPGSRVEMHNCDSTDTNYRLWVEDYFGSIIHETTIVRTGGASDGTTTLSWKMVSSADVEYPHQLLSSPEIVRWNETTGSAITATVEVVTDNVTLTDGECWLEIQYLGTSGFPLGSFTSDAKADVLATAANQTTSTETWTTTGLTTPVKQKLAVTFTPQEKGFIHAVVKLAKASTTVYVDPELTIT